MTARRLPADGSAPPNRVAAPADPGLQPERTVLAWGRTLLAIGVIGVSYLRWLPHFGAWTVLLSLLAIGIAAMCAMAAALVLLPTG